MKAIKHFFWSLVFILVIVIGGAIAYAYSGWYDISVGSGHTGAVNWFIETLRDRSIERGAAEVQVPPLDEPGMFEAGAMVYDRGCAGCHGRPGRDPSGSWEPAPPALTRHAWDPAELFWVVRNGIKMSAMPKIGAERISDEQVWQVAAFLQDASRLTEGEYREIVEPPEPDPAPDESSDEAGGDDEAASADGTGAGDGSGAEPTEEESDETAAGGDDGNG